MKLDESDRRLLDTLGPAPRALEAIADEVDADRSTLRDRLDELAANGLVRTDDGGYRRTESARRLLGTAGGRMDEAIDTTPAIEEVLADADLTPDAADAVRGAYAFLRYWGDATADEIVDAVYSEWPAGLDSTDAWWERVGETLAAVPEVAVPDDQRDAVAALWHYTGTAEVTTPASDGFLPSERRGHHLYGSVRHALAAMDLSGAERTAVRAAFGFLRRRGDADAEAIVEAIFADHAAGYESPEDWWADLVEEVFEELPGVGRVRDGSERWRYDPGPTE